MIDLSGFTYTGPNGAVIPGESFPRSSVIVALNRALRHVFSEEVSAKAPNENKRRERNNLPPLTEDEKAQLRADAVADYIDAIVSGTWGVEDKAYSPRGSENRLAVLFNKAAESATIKKMESDGRTKDESGNYVNPKDNKGYELSVWVKNFLASKVVPEGETKTLGEIRTAEAEAEAQLALEKEQAQRAAKKAARERESNTPELEI